MGADDLTVRTTRWWARGCAALATVLLLGAAPAPDLTPAASAAPAGRTAQDPAAARETARAVQVRVTQLTAQVDAALAQRDRALTGLAGAVQGSLADERAAEDSRQQAEQRQGRHARAVRALYRSGGRVGLVGSVLGSASVEEALDRVVMVERVLALTARTAAGATLDAGAAERTSEATDAGLAAHLTTVADVTAAGSRAELALAAAQTELDGLTARVAALEEAQAAQRALAEARSRTAAALGRSAPTSATDVPVAFETLYRQAAGARCPGMRWTLLAAVGQVESRHGLHNGPSSAGAVGPMQFMPSTFDAYGVDGDGDGTADPWNPADAVHSAAVYLCRNGGGHDDTVPRALLRYNNAQWYVDLVLGVEADLVASGRAG